MLLTRMGTERRLRRNRSRWSLPHTEMSEKLDPKHYLESIDPAQVRPWLALGSPPRSESTS